MESPGDQTRPVEPAGANSTAPADPMSRLLAELETAHERASTAAKLVLELNARLATARTHQQQYQQTLAELQAASQTQQSAKAEADAALQALTIQLETANADRQRLTEQFDARERELEAQNSQRAAELEALKQDLTDARAALVDGQQAYRDIEQCLAQETQTEATLRQSILESRARGEQQEQILAELRQRVFEYEGQGVHQAQNQNDLRQQLQVAAASQEELSQQAAALRQQLAEAQGQHLAAQNELAAVQAAEAAHTAEWQALQRQHEALEQTLATERNLWSTLQDQWAQYKLVNQAVQDATQRQLNDSEAALQVGRTALAAKAGENASLAEQLSLAKQDLAARTIAQQTLQAALDASLAELKRMRQQLSEQGSKIIALEARRQPPDIPLAPAAVEAATAADLAPKLAAPASTAIINRLSQANDLAGIEPVAADPCPHLGLRSDRETRHGYASANNRCYAHHAALEVTLTQQTNICLRDSYRQCPVFTGALRSPKEPINTDPSPARRNLLPWIWGDKK